MTLRAKLQYCGQTFTYPKTPLSDHSANSPVFADLAQIFEPIREDLDAVEQEFVRHIQSRVALIPEMGRYIQKSGGKRVRPAVLLMASRLSGYQGDRAVLYASVVEFIHTATLVHDDIIDGADLRRGRMAVHSRWGNDITVLLGDYLYIKSMAMALTQDSLEIIRLLCDVTLRMIEGELYQLTKTGVVDIAEEEHFEIIRRKTAFLFGGCAQIGGMLGGVTPERESALRDYGFNLGVAFQLVDDLLDYTADQEALGKPIGGDLREGKVTLPIIFLLQRGGAEADRLIRAVVQERAVTPEQWREILRLLARAPRDRARLRTGRRVRQPREVLPQRVSSEPRARRADGASGLCPAARSLTPIGNLQSAVPIVNLQSAVPIVNLQSAVSIFNLQSAVCSNELPHRRAAPAHSPPRRALLHSQRPGDLRRGVRPAVARARAARIRSSRSGHPRLPHAACRRAADREFPDRRARRADAQPRQRVQRRGAPGIRRARAQGGRPR